MTRYDDSRGISLHLWQARATAACGVYEPRHVCGEERFRLTPADEKCKRCAQALAKRDRAFQRKARRGLARGQFCHAGCERDQRLLDRVAYNQLRLDSRDALSAEDGLTSIAFHFRADNSDVFAKQPFTVTRTR